MTPSNSQVIVDLPNSPALQEFVEGLNTKVPKHPYLLQVESHVEGAVVKLVANKQSHIPLTRRHVAAIRQQIADLLDHHTLRSGITDTEEGIKAHGQRALFCVVLQMALDIIRVHLPNL